MAVNSYTMNYSNVVHLPFEEKLKATRLAGCTTMSLMPADILDMEFADQSLANIRARAADAGVTISRLDPLNTWSRHWVSDNMDDSYTLKTATTAREFYRLCAGIGATKASLNAMFPLGSMTIGEMTEDFAATCRYAADFCVTIDLEHVPLWGMPTLEMAWQVVRDAGQPNGRLVFDIWHFVRSGSKLETLRGIPGHLISCVQLSDGPLALPPGVTIKDNCYDRKWPGDGEFPSAQVLRALDEIGGLNEVGAEIFSPMLEGLSTEEVARLSKVTTETVLNDAGVALEPQPTET